MTDHPYEMTITLDVLEHLGLHLYSSTPAVLSEAVANAWDANARKASITLDGSLSQIVVADDGDGMTRTDVNKKFLTIGYQRRQSGDPEATRTRLGRHVMGRKGIGKLSLFAIAGTIDVYTVRTDPESGGEIDRNAFRLRRADIRLAAQDRRTYYPQALPTDSLDFGRGTKIVLAELDRKVTELTRKALRRRLARRFSIIGAPEKTGTSADDAAARATTAASNGAPAPDGANADAASTQQQDSFVVEIDGKPIDIEDRDYFKSVQYLWSIGDVGDRYASQANKAQEKRTISGIVD